MDNQRIDAAIETFRSSIKDVELDSPPSITFCGEEVKRLSHQRKLDNMDADSRIHSMQEDLEYTFTDRIHELAANGDENEDAELLHNARSLCEEWGSLVGLEGHIEGDNPKKYLQWHTQAELQHKFKQKKSIRRLYGSES